MNKFSLVSFGLAILFALGGGYAITVMSGVPPQVYADFREEEKIPRNDIIEEPEPDRYEPKGSEPESDQTIPDDSSEPSEPSESSASGSSVLSGRSQSQSQPMASQSTASQSPSASSALSSPSVSSAPQTSLPPSNPAPPMQGGGTLLVTVSGVRKELPAVEVVSYFTTAEVSDSFEREAIKAQAVASHTYVAYNNSVGRAPDMPTWRTPSNHIVSIVSEVIDKKIYYGGNLINAVYHASSAGRTNSAAEVWGSHIPYLVSVESKYDNAANWDLRKVFSTKETTDLLYNNAKIQTSGPTESWFTILSRTSGGYADRVNICGNTHFTNRAGVSAPITGRAIREQIMDPFSLRSAWFNITIEGDNIVFTTRGWGHGAGMPQNGANEYARREGWTYEQILRHYYTGVSVG
ncbi:MAG: SpoIID/LytB domain-containing protein [Oscillospiraceae bacterium]|nr:SpoIID/LytB domain-containing protein [Oscillospiraceae bacterium]